jgi:hypothetical protein
MGSVQNLIRVKLTCYVRLLDAALGEPLGEHVSHRLRQVGNRKWELGIVAGHCSYVLSVSSEYNKNKRCVGKRVVLTRSFGMSTSTGLASRPSTVLISRMRSER